MFGQGTYLPHRLHRRHAAEFGRLLAYGCVVFLLYYVVGRYHMRHSLVVPGLTTIWLPAGIGLIACLSFGWRALPFVALANGALFAPYLLPGAFQEASGSLAGWNLLLLAIAIAAAQPWLAYKMWQRFTPQGIQDVQSALRFVAWVAVLPNLLTAPLLAATLLASGHLEAIPAGMVVIFSGVLCLASALGILLLTPIYQAWQEEGWPRSRELALILLGLALLLLIQQITLRFDASLIYLTIPILLLVAMTSRALIATVATLTLSIATVGATAGAYGPFVGPEGSVTYLPLMVYLLALATSSLLGRTQYMQVRRSEQELSRLVDERTAALREEVAQRTALGDQMAYHIRRQEQAQAALEEERARLAERVAERTRELQITNLHLAQAAKAKDEFLASMSHELRTPLNTVLMLAELIECETAGPVTEKQRNYLQTMRDSGGHLLGLINDVLDLAKIDAQKLVIEQGSVVVTELCDASMGLIAGQAQQKQIRYTLTLDPQVTVIQADARRTKQILVNLLGNAVKFTPNEGSIGLTVSGDAGAGRVRFVVWDTGIGIHEEDREHLFEPFFQSDSTLARRYEGTGLGLSLARRLARLQGGDITLESEVGKGSQFTLCLPWVEPEAATTAAQPAEAVTTSAAAAHRGADGPPAPLVSHRSPAPLKGELVPSAPMDAEESAGRPAGAPRHVLVVDDTQSFLNAARDYLLLRGYAVSTAGGGNEAIASVRANRPDLILMDIQMPGMDGLEVTQTLRQDPKVAQVPIIALTALAMPGDRERCLAAGMVDYCTKPISLLQLSQVVAKHLGAAPTP